MRAGGTLNLIFTNEGNGCNKLCPVQRPGRYYMLLMCKTTWLQIDWVRMRNMLDEEGCVYEKEQFYKNNELKIGKK